MASCTRPDGTSPNIAAHDQPARPITAPPRPPLDLPRPPLHTRNTQESGQNPSVGGSFFAISDRSRDFIPIAAQTPLSQIWPSLTPEVGYSKNPSWANFRPRLSGWRTNALIQGGFCHGIFMGVTVAPRLAHNRETTLEASPQALLLRESTLSQVSEMRGVLASPAIRQNSSSRARVIFSPRADFLEESPVGGDHGKTEPRTR